METNQFIPISGLVTIKGISLSDKCNHPVVINLDKYTGGESLNTSNNKGQWLRCNQP